MNEHAMTSKGGRIARRVPFFSVMGALVALTSMSSTLAITFDAASSAGAGAVAVVSWPHTVGNGADRMLVVGVTSESAPDALATSVTFGAQALTKVTNSRAVQGSPATATELWYLPAPNMGNATITVNLSPAVSSGNGTACGAVSLFGVKQAAPEAVATSAAGSGGTYSLGITTLTDGAWLVDVVNNGAANASFTTTASGMTERWDVNGDTQMAGACSTREVVTRGAVTDTWTSTGTGTKAQSIAAFAPAPAAQYVIVISVDGLGGTYLSKLFNGTATGGPYSIPNFTRLKNEGASTLAAHCDNNNWETLPNHTSIVTARPRDNSTGFAGHGWTSNGDPAVGQTIHTNKGSYVASVFDVAHDNGLRTGMYANKSKFSLFDTYGSYTGGGSYNATYGALDTTGVDNGRDKIDNTYINTTLGGIIVNTFIAQQKTPPVPISTRSCTSTSPMPTAMGRVGAAPRGTARVVTVDAMLGKIFKLIEQDVPAMTGKTAIILTADHGNQDNPPTGADRYQVPFFVWGPGVPAGADLYTLNAGIRQVASSYPMTTYTGMQPIRNAEANNLALDLLGLGADPRFIVQLRPDPRGHPAHRDARGDGQPAGRKPPAWRRSPRRCRRRTPRR